MEVDRFRRERRHDARKCLDHVRLASRQLERTRSLLLLAFMAMPNAVIDSTGPVGRAYVAPSLSWLYTLTVCTQLTLRCVDGPGQQQLCHGCTSLFIESGCVRGRGGNRRQMSPRAPNSFAIRLQWNGEEVATCPSCSLVIKVIYNPEDFADETEEEKPLKGKESLPTAIKTSN
ncbi:DPH3-like [Tropilaelaps mercedesae]|uniref:DPH3-like n=1 Tax=Tropilaelaps mercedesae TaxID=418985 RepID=A0A1V9XBB1_9ACAR|nr:DPH3-like [Tropilaelaps mercedesae]